MKPLYKFYLDGVERYPVYGEDLAKEIARESGEMYFREKLNGKLTFIGTEYDYINNQVFDWPFSIEIFYSDDGGTSYSSYWLGSFKKQDCEFDADNKAVYVTPEPKDNYQKIIDALDREYDLIQLKPAMRSIRADRRPALQIYIPGQSSIFTYVSGMYWEAECEPVDDDTELLTTYNFSRITDKLVAVTDETGGVPLTFEGNVPSAVDANYALHSGNYVFEYLSSAGYEQWTIKLNGTAIYQLSQQTDINAGYPRQISIPPVGSGASVAVTVRNLSIYTRLLTDSDSFPNSIPLTAQDMIGNNRNYQYISKYNIIQGTDVAYSTQLSNTPTEWGLYQPGQYYDKPTGFVGEISPVTPQSWGRLSIWVAAPSIYDEIDIQGRTTFDITAYSLTAVLNSILTEIDANFYFSESNSKFLYSNTVIEQNLDEDLYIVPKSQIANTRYDEPAGKATITLRQIFDLLRDAMNCYWFLEGGNGSLAMLHLEHIFYFLNGGSYTGSPNVGVDLTTDQNRYGKKWAFAENKWKFEKDKLPSRYSFKWADNVTQPFEGYPIIMLDGVTMNEREGAVENIAIANFSTDIDYIMLNPNRVSMEGFCLLKAGYNDLVDYNNPILVTVPQGTLIVPLPQRTVIAYNGKPGELVFVRYASQPTVPYSGDWIQVWAADENDNLIEPLTGRMQHINDPSIGGYWALPSGTAKIVVIANNGGSFGLYAFESQTYQKVVYYDYYPDGAGTTRKRVLQNGELSFGYMQKYFVYDMPVQNYEINGCNWSEAGSVWTYSAGTGTAKSVKRSKVQEVSYPSENDPNVYNLIKTGLGNGMLQKVSINLCSRNAKTTLGYEPS